MKKTKLNKKIVIFGLVTTAIVLAGALTAISSKIYEKKETSTRTELDLEMEISTDKISYSIGETVLISMELINHGTETISLTTGLPESDFEVLDEQGNQVYLWSNGKFFIAVIRAIIIHPGEVLFYNMTWDQKDNNGNSVPAGTYTIKGWISEYPEYFDTVSIQIQ